MATSEPAACGASAGLVWWRCPGCGEEAQAMALASVAHLCPGRRRQLVAWQREDQGTGERKESALWLGPRPNDP